MFSGIGIGGVQGLLRIVTEPVPAVSEFGLARDEIEDGRGLDRLSLNKRQAASKDGFFICGKYSLRKSAVHNRTQYLWGSS